MSDSSNSAPDDHPSQPLRGLAEEPTISSAHAAALHERETDDVPSADASPKPLTASGSVTAPVEPVVESVTAPFGRPGHPATGETHPTKIDTAEPVRLAPVTALAVNVQHERFRHELDGAEDSDDDSSDGGPLGHPSIDAAAPAARLALVTGTTAAERRSLEADMSRLSLEQALLDVEVANARVIDLTARLVEAQQRTVSLRNELDELRGQVNRTEGQIQAEVARRTDDLIDREAEVAARAAHLDRQKSSTAYRWAAKVWNVRNALRS
jgi:hypothetical protein